MAANLLGSLPVLSPDQLNDNRSQMVFSCAIAFVVIDISFIGMRYFTRHITKTPLGWDDLLVFPTMLFSVSVCGMQIAMVKYAGLGRHIVSLQLPIILEYAKMSIAFEYLYSFAITFPKLAIICLYLRIFVERKHRLICYIMIAATVLYTVMALLITSFMCIPLKSLWDPSITDARCIDIINWWRWSTLPNSLGDIILLALPVPMILKLKLPARDRAVVLCIFFTGGIGLVASIVRIVTFCQTPGLGDLTWDGVKLGIAGIVETGTYLIAVSLLSMRPLYTHFKKKRQNSTSQATMGSSIQLTTKPFTRLNSSRGSSPSDGSTKSFSHSSEPQAAFV